MTIVAFSNSVKALMDDLNAMDIVLITPILISQNDLSEMPTPCPVDVVPRPPKHHANDIMSKIAYIFHKNDVI